MCVHDTQQRRVYCKDLVPGPFNLTVDRVEEQVSREEQIYCLLVGCLIGTCKLEFAHICHFKS